MAWDRSVVGALTGQGFVGRTRHAREYSIQQQVELSVDDNPTRVGLHGRSVCRQGFRTQQGTAKLPKLPQNRVSKALTEYIGIYPTLVELTGVEKPESTTLVKVPGAPENMDAQSFAGVLLDPDREGPAAVFSEYALKSDIPRYMIRTKRFKFHYNHGSTHELYDLENDPDENINQISKAAKIKNPII